MVFEVAALVAWAQATVNSWGYLGIFFINLINSASVIIPLPLSAATLLFVHTLNPWLIILVASWGAAIGELLSYGVGYGGRSALKDGKSAFREKARKWVARMEKWSDRHGPFAIILLIASLPLPITDFVGLFSGVIAYDMKKFFLAVFIGKVIKFTIFIFTFLYGSSWLFAVTGSSVTGGFVG
ncbi:MAG: VTT domain-containing protein [Candidatus Aenigmarchaeota archaeon]|nr:VTT domain-containing protein [Candidatus Aenigmarchaeota archaeon]